MTVPTDPPAREPSTDGLVRRGLRVIWLALRGAPLPFGIGIGAAALFAAMTVASTFVLRWVTDEVLLPAFDTGQLDRTALALAVAAILGVAVLKATGVVGRRLGAYYAQFTLQARYRREVTGRYLQLPLTWHRRHPTGELLSNANADVESAFFVAAPLPMAVGASLLLVITGGLLVVTDPALAAIGFGVGPLLGFANWFYQRRMRHAATVAQQARADVSEVAHESFDSALVVKTLGREDAEAERFRASTENLRDKMITVGRLRAFFDPVIEALPSVGILLVLWVGAHRVQAGALTAGDLVLFSFLFRLVALPMRVFGWLLGELPRAVVGWDRVSRVLATTGEMVYGEASGDGDGGARVAMREVGFHHPAPARGDLAGPDARRAVGRTARRPHTDPPGAAATTSPAPTPDGRGIRSVSFEVAPGRTVALVGATGSGKSTVAALLARLHDPDRGRVRFDDVDLTELSRDGLARNVAIVFQEAFLFDDSVRGNITLGEDFRDEEVEAAARLAQAHGFVTALPDGYETQIGERGATLSGGQRQRLALARALIRRPRLLVLDDATSAVDPSVESDILRGLAAAGLGATVVIVAYRRGSIVLADEVVFLEDGVVAGRGDHRELLATLPTYAALVTAYEAEQEAAAVPDAAGDAPGSHVAGSGAGSSVSRTGGVRGSRRDARP